MMFTKVWRWFIGEVPVTVVTVTTSRTDTPDADGFTRTLWFYARGPGDPPGNQWIWMCDRCDQVRSHGHAPDCPWLAVQQMREAE